MNSMNKGMKGLLFTVLLVTLPLVGLALVGKYLGWGFIETKTQNRVVVTGVAKEQQTSQVATINAGVMVLRDSKEEAVNEVNTTIGNIIEAIKDQGVSEKDVKTTGMSVYQEEEMIPGTQRRQPIGWRVSNNIEVKVRDLGMVEPVMGLLTSMGATNVNGPYYSVEEQEDGLDESLRKSAFEDAKRKAEQMAELSGRKLGRVLSIQDGGSVSGVNPLYDRAMGLGGGGGFEPGSSQVSRSLVVEFELR